MLLACFLCYRSLFGSSEFNKLAPSVDAFSLMTYDYSSPGRSEISHAPVSLFTFHSSQLVFVVLCPFCRTLLCMFRSYEFAYSFFISVHLLPHPFSPGPNSPMEWVEECVLSLAPELSPQRQKILLGLNFYGYDFTSSGMDGTARL